MGVYKLWVLLSRIQKYFFLYFYKNYRSYYVKSLAVELYFLYMSSYQMNFQFKHFQKFWWILIIYCNLCQFHAYATARNRLKYLFLQTLLFLFAQTTWWSRKHDISENFWTKSLFEKTRLSDSLNNNDGNFCSIKWSVNLFTR